MKLVVVETAAQAKAVAEVLGEGWRLEACGGMVRALPEDALGIDLAADFQPRYGVAPGKGPTVRRLMKALRECESVIAATPPGIDGEAMGWHVLALAPEVSGKPVGRVTLASLRPEEVRAAFSAVRALDMRQVEAHVSRRIIERLLGWGVSAAARREVDAGVSLSAAAIVALRLALAGATAEASPQDGWRAAVTFTQAGGRWQAAVLNARGGPLVMRSARQAEQLLALLRQAVYWVDRSGQRLQQVAAPPALELPELLETAERALDLRPERVLALLETLYAAGWITHAQAAPPEGLDEAARGLIRREYGLAYLDTTRTVLRGLAPADVSRLPEEEPGDGAALYGLIWRRYLAGLLPPAQDRVFGARVLAGPAVGAPYPLELRLSTALPTFDGWRRVLPQADSGEAALLLREGDRLQAETVTVEALPAAGRLPTRASLAGGLVRLGFAAAPAARTVSALIEAGHLEERGGGLALSGSGQRLASFIAGSFGALASPGWAAELAADVRAIAAGERTRLEVLRAFRERSGDVLFPPAGLRQRAGSGR